MLLLGASGAAVVQAWRIKAAAATCRVRLVFMTFHSTEPERSMRNMPDINSRLQKYVGTLGILFDEISTSQLFTNIDIINLWTSRQLIH